MSGDLIEDLLRAADRQAPPAPAGPADLVGRVRRRQHRRRLAATAAMPIALLATAAAAFLGAALRPAATSPGRDPAAEMAAALQGQIRIHRLTVEQMNQLAQAREQQVAAAAVVIPDPLEAVRERMETAAYAVIRLAASLERSPGGAEDAAKAYRQVIEYFPDTSWAKVAQARLSTPQPTTGETL